jgi:hypothetical protein
MSRIERGQCLFRSSPQPPEAPARQKHVTTSPMRPVRLGWCKSAVKGSDRMWQLRKLTVKEKHEL